MTDDDTSRRIPLLEEELSIATRNVETGRVRIRTVTDERTEFARAELFREAVEVERVPVDVDLDHVPQPWEDGDTLVIPIVEEILVVRKQLVVREELRVKRVRSAEEVSEPVTLKSMQAVVERTPALPKERDQ